MTDRNSFAGLSRFLCCLFKGAHDVLPRDNAFQLTVGIQDRVLRFTIN
jgi:hypothetical protein